MESQEIVFLHMMHFQTVGSMSGMGGILKLLF